MHRGKHSNEVVRTGFTLVELLVVIAIIGTLVGLLLPAVPSELKYDDFVLRPCDAGHPINSQFSRSVLQNANGTNGDCDGFGSRHPGGAQFVMCDGSVQFMSENIQSATSPLGAYQRLSHRADGLTLGDY